jgi:hypothetical protein
LRRSPPATGSWNRHFFNTAGSISASRGATIGIITTTLRSLGVRSGSTHVYECRHCGTTVEDDTTECPACGRSGVVEFTIG